MKKIGAAHYVLPGESTDGTYEYYTWRTAIAKCLVMKKGFNPLLFIWAKAVYPLPAKPIVIKYPKHIHSNIRFTKEMQRTSYYIINGITFYRVIASLLLLYFIISDQPGLFKWFLAISFFTDAIDGFLARHYHVSSVMGAKIDSIGDDLTVLMGVIGLFVFKEDFISRQYFPLIVMFMLFVIQVISALIRYGALTSFHTYLAKLAAVLQGTFLILAFFFNEPSPTLFYLAIAVTTLDLVEEIAITWVLTEKRENVKGLYWVIREKRALLFLPIFSLFVV